MEQLFDHLSYQKVLREVAKNCRQEQAEKVIKASYIAKHHQNVVNYTLLDLHLVRKPDENCKIYV